MEWAGKGIFLFVTAVSTPTLGPSQPPVQWVRAVFTTGVTRPGREATDQSPPYSVEVKKARSYTPIPQYFFLVWYLIQR
jgi:hypothetical protein